MRLCMWGLNSESAESVSGKKGGLMKKLAVETGSEKCRWNVDRMKQGVYEGVQWLVLSPAAVAVAAVRGDGEGLDSAAPPP